MEPMLLYPLPDGDQAFALALREGWILEPKYDGDRMLTQIVPGNYRCANRKGEPKGFLRPAVRKALDHLVAEYTGPPFVLDGEVVGDTYYIFDILTERCGNDTCPCRGLPRAQTTPHLALVERKAILAALPDPLVHEHSAVRKGEYAVTETDKRMLIQRLRDERWEGYVLKGTQSPYTPGRSSMGPFKVKFYKTLSAIVAGHDPAKDAIHLALMDRGEPVLVGRCKAAVKPPIGSVIEVRYLYRTTGGRLYQPVLLGVRSDIDPGECTVEQAVLQGGDNA